MPDQYDQIRYMEGVGAFQQARLRAFWSDLFGLVRGKPAELLSFEDVRARLRLREEDYKGTHEVPLDAIVGSVGRYSEFTRDFLPKRNVMQERWSRVYAQANGMMGLPPIELYKVGDVYFVRDGNHRVSVARQLGAHTIQAHVTELRTPISLQPDINREELDAATSYAEFLDVTRLPFTRPHHQPIELTEPSRYNDLVGHINLHRGVMSATEGRDVSLEDAAANWYDTVYRPALTLMRKYGTVEMLGGRRTEGDIYLWMIEHLREMREAFGEDTKTRSFSDALVDYLTQKRIPIPKDLLIEGDESVQIARVDIEKGLEALRAAEREAALENDADSNGANAPSPNPKTRRKRKNP